MTLVGIPPVFGLVKLIADAEQVTPLAFRHSDDEVTVVVVGTTVVVVVITLPVVVVDATVVVVSAEQ